MLATRIICGWSVRLVSCVVYGSRNQLECMLVRVRLKLTYALWFEMWKEMQKRNVLGCYKYG
jgi:hypothetical protein